MISTVPASATDEAFLFELFVSTRLADFSGLGWSEADLEALLILQYKARQFTYRQRYPTLAQDVVRQGDAPIGQVSTYESDAAIHLVEIALLKAYRGQGIGSALIRGLQRRAARSGKALRLQVAVDNPALRLYRRLGFRRSEERFPYVQMEWSLKKPAPIRTPT